MATIKELSSYRGKELKTANEQLKEYETYRNAQVSKAYKTQAAQIDAQVKHATQQYRDQIAQVDDDYRSLYDANAVNELISRRQVEERMANLGLSDSGLNRTQLTATAVTRSTADAAVDRQKQTCVDKLNQLIIDTVAQGEQEKLRSKSELTEQALEDTESYRLKTLEWAEGRAKNNYEAAYKSYTDHYNRFVTLGMEEALAREYAQALVYGNQEEVAAAQNAYANFLKEKERKKLQKEKAEKLEKEQKEKAEKLEKEKKAYEEKRNAYAKMLIQSGIFYKIAWQEAYLLYPDVE